MDTLFPGPAATASFSYPFQQSITNQDELRALIGTPDMLARGKRYAAAAPANRKSGHKA